MTETTAYDDLPLVPLTADRITPEPEHQAEHAAEPAPSPTPELTGTSALDLILPEHPTLTLSTGETFDVKFDLRALANLERRFGTIMRPIRTIVAAAQGLESDAADTPPLFDTLLATLRCALQRSVYTNADGNRVRADSDETWDEFVGLIDTDLTPMQDLIALVTVGVTTAFGALGKAQTTTETQTPPSPFPGATGGTPPSASGTSTQTVSGI